MFKTKRFCHCPQGRIILVRSRHALPSTFVKTSDSASAFAKATADKCATPDKSADKFAGKHKFAEGE
jgi:hypothetical protein